ncbi:MAG: N-acetylneuraminate synthase family protein [Gammaproteobacteria bacterium]|nr:N-acetylneuraminate synthase family protein [Gammaproteobacteria bacterium]MCI0591343.1 N-acetylneuraminate synthase family protein [Gammaproteobacteria bacterium]
MHPFPFKPEFEIGHRRVGGGAPVLIIAEAGVSHFGDVTLAVQLVELAAKAGADAFKTQVFDVDALYASREPAWRERLRTRNLTLAECRELKALCAAKGLLFMATAHDESRIPWLVELNVPAIKVGSGERNNPEFLKKLAALGKPMIVSTGMYGDTDVIEVLDTLAETKCDELALLHCVTCYPTPPHDVNLLAMDRLSEIFPGPVGYSDHTPDGVAVLAAVARGACIVEKHITILRDVPNAQDWKVSAGPDDFPKLVAEIRRVESMLGHGRKEMAHCEQGAAGWALKSMVAARDLPKGHYIVEGDVIAKRPGLGVPPSRISDFYGHRLKHSIAADTALRFEDID